jgi:hypothetical protein|tara:strand:+ start:295 stop:882 length:588 start_codon:yes stop_codon:yes gene_type:complete
MKSTEMLNKIKTLLDIQIKLEEMSLENGTKIESESFEKGKEVFILTDDERVALPVGEYILEDSRLLIVESEGIIGDIREVADEAPQKEEESKEEITEDLVEDEEEMVEEADVADWKGMEVRIKNLEDAIADLKKDKVEASEVLEKVKEELSKPASNPIKHSPESGKSEKPKGFLYSQNRVGSTMDRVLARLNNNK